MAENSKIQWTDHTKNLWWGCVEVSPGCDRCYARTLAERWGREVWGVHARRFFTKDPFKDLDKWQKEAEKSGQRRRVFVQSMSDICEILPDGHPDRLEMDNRRHLFFEGIRVQWSMLDFQLLTKRVGNYAKVVPASWMKGDWPENAWAGISVVNQPEADRDIPKLVALPAPVKFLSCEPLIASVDLSPWLRMRVDAVENPEQPLTYYGKWVHGGLSWVIVGGESGHGARGIDSDWIRSLIAQCKSAGVPIFVKQMGAVYARHMEFKDRAHGGDIDEWLPEFQVRQMPEVDRG